MSINNNNSEKSCYLRERVHGVVTRAQCQTTINTTIYVLYI